MLYISVHLLFQSSAYHLPFFVLPVHQWCSCLLALTFWFACYCLRSHLDCPRCPNYSNHISSVKGYAEKWQVLTFVWGFCRVGAPFLIPVQDNIFKSYLSDQQLLCSWERWRQQQWWLQEAGLWKDQTRSLMILDKSNLSVFQLEEYSIDYKTV